MTMIHHVNVMVDDLEAAVEFYRDVIGLQAIDTPELGFPAQFFAVGEDQQLHVNQLGDVHPERSHFCLRVDDFDRIVASADERGAIDAVTWGLATRLASGVVQLFVRDPSGNLIELNSSPDHRMDAAFHSRPYVDPAMTR
jgi:catechol 2,3-dioxygenase-like lactoylglutathione lyase family enzyme